MLNTIFNIYVIVKFQYSLVITNIKHNMMIFTQKFLSRTIRILTSDNKQEWLCYVSDTP